MKQSPLCQASGKGSSPLVPKKLCSFNISYTDLEIIMLLSTWKKKNNTRFICFFFFPGKTAVFQAETLKPLTYENDDLL